METDKKFKTSITPQKFTNSQEKFKISLKILKISQDILSELFLQNGTKFVNKNTS